MGGNGGRRRRGKRKRRGVSDLVFSLLAFWLSV